jgi:hypothetical protein
MNCQDEYLIYLITKKWTVCQWFNLFCPECQLLRITAGGVARVGERVTFSSPDENARAGETAPKFQCQPTLATPLVVKRFLLNLSHMMCQIQYKKYHQFLCLVNPTILKTR